MPRQPRSAAQVAGKAPPTGRRPPLPDFDLRQVVLDTAKSARTRTSGRFESCVIYVTAANGLAFIEARVKPSPARVVSVWSDELPQETLVIN